MTEEYLLKFIEDNNLKTSLFEYTHNPMGDEFTLDMCGQGIEISMRIQESGFDGSMPAFVAKMCDTMNVRGD